MRGTLRKQSATTWQIRIFRGRDDDAERTARLARSVAPAYAAQALGSLGADGATTP